MGKEVVDWGCLLQMHASVAQLVEQVTHIHYVGGSIPPTGTNNKIYKGEYMNTKKSIQEALNEFERLEENVNEYGWIVDDQDDCLDPWKNQQDLEEERFNTNIAG